MINETVQVHGSRVDIESDLRNQNRLQSQCNNYKYQPGTQDKDCPKGYPGGCHPQQTKPSLVQEHVCHDNIQRSLLKKPNNVGYSLPEDSCK